MREVVRSTTKFTFESNEPPQRVLRGRGLDVVVVRRPREAEIVTSGLSVNHLGGDCGCRLAFRQGAATVPCAVLGAVVNLMLVTEGSIALEVVSVSSHTESP